MKKIIFYLVLAVSLFNIAHAQPSQNEKHIKGQQKIQALYIAYITQQLNLNESEAQKFWPVHTQFDTEIKAVNVKKSTELEREEASLNVKKKYQDKFSKIIGADRTDDFYRKDMEFRRKMVDQLKKAKQNKIDLH